MDKQIQLLRQAKARWPPPKPLPSGSGREPNPSGQTPTSWPTTGAAARAGVPVPERLQRGGGDAGGGGAGGQDGAREGEAQRPPPRPLSPPFFYAWRPMQRFWL